MQNNQILIAKHPAARGLFILCLLLSNLVCLLNAGANEPIALHSQAISVGVLSFDDESGANAPTELGGGLARELRKMLLKHQDVLPRIIQAPADGASVQSMAPDQIAALGKPYGVKFVVRGALLALNVESVGGETRINALLYADVISVESGGVISLRA